MAINPDPTAVFGRRIGAVFIDGALLFIPLFILLSSHFEYADKASTSAAAEYCEVFNDNISNGVCASAESTVYFDEHFGDHLGEAWWISIGAAVVNFVLLQGLTGWSIGKLLTGIRVVREDGQRANVLWCLVRWLLWVVDGFPFLLPGLVGFITGLTTQGHRRVGDMVAKTYVVRSAAVGHPVAPPGYSPMGGPVTYGAPAWTTATPAPTAKSGPQWDEARGTYIQWDPEATEWMRWDDAAKRWEPIPPTPSIPPPPAPSPPSAPPAPPAPPPPPADPVPPAPPAPPSEPPLPPGPPTV